MRERERERGKGVTGGRREKEEQMLFLMWFFMIKILMREAQRGRERGRRGRISVVS